MVGLDTRVLHEQPTEHITGLGSSAGRALECQAQGLGFDPRQRKLPMLGRYTRITRAPLAPNVESLGNAEEPPGELTYLYSYPAASLVGTVAFLTLKSNKPMIQRIFSLSHFIIDYLALTEKPIFPTSSSSFLNERRNLFWCTIAAKWGTRCSLPFLLIDWHVMAQSLISVKSKGFGARLHSAYVQCGLRESQPFFARTYRRTCSNTCTSLAAPAIPLKRHG